MGKSSDYAVGDPRRVQSVAEEMLVAHFTEPLSGGKDCDKIDRAARIFAEAAGLLSS